MIANGTGLTIVAELKTLPEHFEAVFMGYKTFEV